MAYQPIENYGVIGDCETAALVSTGGSIDWFCYPRFDSPSAFGALLDDRKGGCFEIAPASEGARHKQFYWPDTNVLVTRFLSDEGVGEVVDFMPVAGPGGPPRQLVRRVRAVRGSLHFRARCAPAFDYGRDVPRAEPREGGAAFVGRTLSLVLAAGERLRARGGEVAAEFCLREGQSTTFVLREPGPGEAEGGPVAAPAEAETEALFEGTVAYWRSWLARCSYQGRWREQVYRSALALKLLTYRPTGAIVAAPTTSLPERVGGDRNWDYRYTWVRDAAFTVYALMRVGFTEEAAGFMRWLDGVCHTSGPEGGLHVLYGVDGRRELVEESLDHLEGYRGSRPVRVGNAASSQLQLDMYGELMDSLYLYNKYGEPISYDLWRRARRLTDWVCDHWRKPDAGVWEIRAEPRHFVYSKMMCWVALDRALRLADKRSLPADRARWLAERDAIYEEVMARGFDEEAGSFVQAYGGRALDASALLMPLVFFVSPTDPRMLRTLEALNRPRRQGGLAADGLMYRYDPGRSPDGLEGEEGTFNLCTFWLVEALTRAGRNDRRRLDEARLIFERMLGFANHLGLYAEQTGPSGEALGNFPQALTHLSLISAAFNLDRALGGRRPRPRHLQ